MGTLSLCADSARPPGTSTKQAFSDGLCITAGKKSCDQEQSKSAPPPFPVTATVTAYYSQLPSTMPSLHAISTLAHPYNNSTATRQLTDWYLLFVPCHSIATLFASSNRKSTRNRKRLDQTNSQHGKQDNQLEIMAITTNEQISQRKINSQGTQTKIATTTTNDTLFQEETATKARESPMENYGWPD